MAYYCKATQNNSTITVSYKANKTGKHTWNYNLNRTTKTSALSSKDGTWTSTDEGAMSKSLSYSTLKTNYAYYGSIGTSSTGALYYLFYVTRPAAPTIDYAYSGYNSTGSVVYMSVTDVSDWTAMQTITLTVSSGGTTYYTGTLSPQTSSGLISFTIPYNGSSNADLQVTLTTKPAGTTTSNNNEMITVGGTLSATTMQSVSIYPSYPSPTYYNKVLAYNANGGENTPGSQSNYSTSYSYTFTISSDIPTRNGYKFLGWGDSSTGTASYQPGGTISVSAGTKTIYAIWEKLPDIKMAAIVGGNLVTGTPYVKRNGGWRPVTKAYKMEASWGEVTSIDISDQEELAKGVT